MSPRQKRKTPSGAKGQQGVEPPPPPPAKTKTAITGSEPVIVGIGASAGGLEALRSFFGAMPERTGATFVVVLHLDPTHESFMPELLARCTPLKVEQAKDRQPLEAEHVYIIPPNRFLTIDQGLLRLAQPVDRRALRGTIDHFFRSLAVAQRERAIGIVLSGAGTEGALGLKEIKAEGGMVMVQSPDSASYSGMPESAIATGLVDIVLPPEQMPEALVRYLRHPYSARLKPPEVGEPATRVNGLISIIGLLRARQKHDFLGYKRGTLLRRIQRRMGLQQIETIPKYLELLRSSPAELDALAKDLLIKVTSFFRDAPAFEELATKVLAPLARAKDGTPVRVWVPGCATGEEAYSIAMLLAEQIQQSHSNREFTIFATDVDEDALQVARAATYPDSVALDITPQRLQRFFTHQDHRYKVAKSIRDAIVFAEQNVISDPPFSRLDLVSCRNVLIYLEPDAQKHILGIFHFALKPGGHLFLGSAESVAREEHLFSPLSTQWRIYNRLAAITRPSVNIPYVLQEPLTRTTTAEKANLATEPSMTTVAEQYLLQRFAPAAVAIGPTGQITHVFGPIDRYLKLKPGTPTLDVVTLARDDLKATLRAALGAASKRHQEVAMDVSEAKGARRRRHLRIVVSPVKTRTSEGVTLVIFQEPAPSGVAVPPLSVKQRDFVRMLESELKNSKEEQRSLVDQLEGSNEELKAANEEAVSMNEELQSTNEELVGSKEELQSLNEELSTMNAQLQEKVTELSRANDDLNNLFIATDVATIFVDGELRIARFTTAATQLLNLIPSDVNRPIGHLAHNLLDFDLTREVDTVRRSGVHMEKTVRGQNGRHYIVRISPYLREATTPLGFVITFIDVTTVKQSELDLRDAREQVADDLRRMTRLHALGVELLAPGNMATVLIEVLHAAIDITGAELGNIQIADDHGTLTIAAHVGFEQPFLDHFARVDTHTDSVCGHALATRQRAIVEDINTSPTLAGTSTLAVLQAAGVHAVQSTPLFDQAGSLIGMLSTHYRAPHTFGAAETRWLDLLGTRATHLIDRAQLERRLREAKSTLEEQIAERTRKLQLALDGAKAGTWHIDLRTDQVTWDERSRSFFGSTAHGPEPFDRTFRQAHQDDRAALAKRLEEMKSVGNDTWDVEYRVLRPDGRTLNIHALGQAERDSGGRLIAISGINLDVSAQKAAEEALRASRAEQEETAETMQSLLAASAEGILTTAGDGVIKSANAALEAMFGYAVGELAGQPLESLVPESWRAEHAKQHENYWLAPRSRPMGQGLDLVGRRKDGSTFPIEVSLTYVRSVDGGRVLAIVEDITERRRAEDELRRNHAALQAQTSELLHRTQQLRRLASDLTLAEQNAREQLAKRLHDDLQQLLFSARINLDRAATAAAETPGAQPALDEVRTRLDEAIESARSLSMELFPPLHILGLSAAVNWLAKWMKEKYGLTVHVTADRRATVDQRDLRTLAFESVRELLFDVVKHAKVDRATVDLTLTPDDQVQIRVADEGVGFDPAAVLSHTAAHIGWGLFSIRERAELLGGHLEVQSAPGRGTTFTLTIPRVMSQARATWPPLRILLADDHDEMRAGFREILAERPEFEIVGEASTGAEAVRLAHTLKPDAIIMDVVMPEMDGVEATRQIHAAQPDIQIFGLSMQERPEGGVHAIEEAGAVGYFTKQGDAQRLVERLLALPAKANVSA